MKTVAIIPAGGSGKRMQGRLPKQYLSVGGTPILVHTLSVFQLSPDIDEIVLVVLECWQGGSKDRIPCETDWPSSATMSRSF
jgi:2-C-methyl-D-erythritol 4-phosphate cytidylyltransferase